MKLIIFFFALILFVSCEKDGATADNNSVAQIGKGGSLARFTIVGEHLYIVDAATLKVFNITNAANPNLVNTENLRFGVETIYAYKDKLFIGSTDGMYIYSIATPASPVLLGEARHTRSCDPVVANDSIAFVSLRGNQPCGPAQDGLYIYDIKNLVSPVLLKMQAVVSPHGLGLQDSILYVCQKTYGMSIYNVSNPSTPILRKTIVGKTFEDVICYDNILVCQVSTGLALYDISTPANPIELSMVNN